jgi:hypothetical protein
MDLSLTCIVGLISKFFRPALGDDEMGLDSQLRKDFKGSNTVNHTEAPVIPTTILFIWDLLLFRLNSRSSKTITAK